MKIPENIEISKQIRTSDLPNIKRSPAHFLSNRLEPEESTDAQNFGTAFHTSMLEVKKFAERFWCFNENFRPVQDKDFRNPENREWKKEQFELNKDKIAVSAEEMKIIYGIRENIKNDPLLPDLLSTMLFEYDMKWTDPDTGLELGSRLDGITPPEASKTIILEAKTTTDASEYGCISAIRKHFYHGKAYFQSQGVEHALGRKVDYYIFLFCEKKKPYAINKIILSEETFQTVSNEVGVLLHDIKECFDKNNFPGYEKNSLNELGLTEVHIYGS